MGAPMNPVSATEVRKNWSLVCDDVARNKPRFIRRTHDDYIFASREYMLRLLEQTKYHVQIEQEDDGSWTGIVIELDLAENAPDKTRLIDQIAASILDYANEYYSDFQVYANAPNRTHHIPYITKALLLGNIETIRGEIICHDGKI